MTEKIVKNEAYYDALAMERYPDQLSTYTQFKAHLVKNGGVDLDAASGTAYRGLVPPPGGYQFKSEKLHKGSLGSGSRKKG